MQKEPDTSCEGVMEGELVSDFVLTRGIDRMRVQSGMVERVEADEKRVLGFETEGDGGEELAELAASDPEALELECIPDEERERRGGETTTGTRRSSPSPGCGLSVEWTCDKPGAER